MYINHKLTCWTLDVISEMFLVLETLSSHPQTMMTSEDATAWPEMCKWLRKFYTPPQLPSVIWAPHHHWPFGGWWSYSLLSFRALKNHRIYCPLRKLSQRHIRHQTLTSVFREEVNWFCPCHYFAPLIVSLAFPFFTRIMSPLLTRCPDGFSSHQTIMASPVLTFSC